MKYQIEIVETTSKVETIEASSKAEALKMVREAYENDQIILTNENSFANVDFNII